MAGRFAHGGAGEARIGTGTVALSEAALDLLPYPVAVTDSSRAVVSANQRFDTELRSGVEDTCCDIVGCATLGACVTTVVLERNRPWRGVVADGPGSTRELLATPLPSGDRVALRFGEVRTRPQEPRESGQVLRFFCLGSLQIDDGSGAAVAPDWLRQRPGTLLKYLLTMRHRHVRHEEIAEALWEAVDADGAGNVRYLVHQLRKRLEPDSVSGARSRCVRKDAAGYRLDPSNVWVDVDAFEAEVRAGVAAAVGGDMLKGEQALLRAVALYRGDFLGDDPYEEWALRERDRLHALLVMPLRILIDARLAAGDVERAAAHAERLAMHEPLDGDLQRLSLELLLRLGRRGRALRQYEMFRTRLWRALGVAPAFELVDLIEIDR